MAAAVRHSDKEETRRRPDYEVSLWPPVHKATLISTSAVDDDVTAVAAESTIVVQVDAAFLNASDASLPLLFLTLLPRLSLILLLLLILSLITSRREQLLEGSLNYRVFFSVRR